MRKWSVFQNTVKYGIGREKLSQVSSPSIFSMSINCDIHGIYLGSANQVLLNPTTHLPQLYTAISSNKVKYAQVPVLATYICTYRILITEIF